MDRSFRDSTSQRGQDGRRGLHTYTPRSHEDLMRSHLQLDAARKNKLHNDLQRLSAENDRLRRELDKANREILDKDNQIDFLNNELKNKHRTPPRTPSPTYATPYEQAPVFEVDGKQLTLDDLLHHFSVIINRHHELINLKNQKIQELKDELDNNKYKPRASPQREAETQSPKYQEPNALQQNLANEFSRQLALIRKEYEQVEYLLTERNNRLENLIKQLQDKLDQYQKEIQYLRNELAAQGGKQEPNDETMRLIREKEKENNYLKKIISNLQKPNNNCIMPEEPNMNEELINEIKKIIAGKQDAIHKLNNMITDVKKDNVDGVPENPDMSEVKKDCENMLSDLNNMNDKLNNILRKLKDSPTPVPGETLDKDNLISNLENLKKQCQDEKDNLERQIGPDGAKTGPDMIMQGHAVLKIDDPRFLLKRSVPPGTESGEALPEDPVETVSKMRFAFYPLSSQVPRERVRPAEQPLETYEYPPRPLEERPRTPETPPKFIQEPRYESYPPKHKHYSPVPCEACNEIPSEKSITFLPKVRQKSKEYSPPREEPVYIQKKPVSKTTPKTPPPKKKMIEEFYSPSVRARSIEKQKKRKGGGCCGNKGSTTSNVPYQKYPEEEKVMNVHSPYRNENPQNLYPVLDKDDYTYELSSISPEVRRKNLNTGFKKNR